MSDVAFLVRIPLVRGVEEREKELLEGKVIPRT